MIQAVLIVLVVVGMIEVLLGFAIIFLNMGVAFPSTEGLKLAERLFWSGIPICIISLLALHIWF